MSYTKQTWATGDTITAQKLNHMEDGIGGAVPLTPDTLIVTFTFNKESHQFESDTTFQDMVSAAYNEMKAILAVVPVVGTIPLMAKADSQGNIVNFHYTDCETNGTGPVAGAITVTFTRFEVYYDSEDDRTICQFTSVDYNFQKSAG